jgi:hypothetical protein
VARRPRPGPPTVTTLTVTTLAAAAHAATSTTVGDATATQGANACTWTMGTAAVSKTVTFSSGTFTMTSLLNKLVTGSRQYERAGTASGEFQFTWDSVAYSDASGGWTCASGHRPPVRSADRASPR